MDVTTSLAGAHRAPARTAGSRVASIASVALVAVAVVVLLATAIGPHLFGYRVVTMLSGSMAPGIATGDLVVDVEEPIDALRPGQVVTYEIPVGDRHVETHRVVWVGHDRSGAVLFRTRGDANATADPWTARAEARTIWRVAAVVPDAGLVVRWLRLPLVQLIGTRVLPALLAAWLLVAVWRRPRPARR